MATATKVPEAQDVTKGAVEEPPLMPPDTTWSVR